MVGNFSKPIDTTSLAREGNMAAAASALYRSATRRSASLRALSVRRAAIRASQHESLRNLTHAILPANDNKPASAPLLYLAAVLRFERLRLRATQLAALAMLRLSGGLGRVDIRGFPVTRECDSRSQIEGGDLDSTRAHRQAVAAYRKAGSGQEGRQGSWRQGLSVVRCFGTC